MSFSKTKGLPDRLPEDVRPDEVEHKAVVWTSGAFEALLSKAGRQKLVETIESQILWAGYGRYSTDEQDPDSLKRQYENCAPFWLQDGHKMHRWEYDAGRSGTTMHGRKGLERTMASARRREFHRLIVEDVDRLARNVGQLILMFEELSSLGIELWDVKHGKLEWLQVYTLGMIAQIGRNRIVDVTSGGRRMAIKRGRIMNAPIFGYMNHKLKKKVRLIDPELAEVVVWVFQRIAEGASCWQVAKDLCEKYPGRRPGSRVSKNPNRAPFDEKFVRRLITNPLYMGLSLYERATTLRDFATKKVTGRREKKLGETTIVEVEHLRIVPIVLWARANAKLAERAPGGGGGGIRVGPLSGCVRDECGAPMKRHGPPDRRMYMCSNHVRGDTSRCKLKGGWTVAWVETVVLDKIADLVGGRQDDAKLRAHVERAVAEAKAHDRRERARMTVRRAQLARELKRLWDEAEIVGLRPAQLADMRHEACLEAESLDRSLSAESREAEFDEVLEDLDSVGKAIEQMRGRLPFKAETAEDQGYVEVLRDIVRDVTLHRTGRPGITRVVLRLRLGAPVTPQEREEEDNPQLSFLFGEEPDDVDDQDYVVDFEAEAFDRAKPRADAAAVRAADVARQAETGTHDVSDRVWRIAKPLLARVDFGEGEAAVEPRRLMDALVFALATGTDWKALPPRYGAAGAVLNALKRMARRGTLDPLIDALVAEAPKDVAGLPFHKLRNTRFPRSNAALAPGRGPDAVKLGPKDVALLQAAAAVQLDDAARARMLAVALRIEGVSQKEVATRFGYSEIYVSNLLGGYRAQGLPALTPGVWNQPETVFTRKVLDRLAKFVALGFDPDRPQSALTLDRVNAFARTIGVDVTIQHLGRKLQDNGISLRDAIAAERLRRAKAA